MAIYISQELLAAILSLINSGVKLVGGYTDEELLKMAADEEARSDALQERQESE